MVRHGSNKANDASDLVNFHFSSSSPSQSHMTSPSRRNQPSAQKNREQYRRSGQDRASARRKAASSMFYLHSSPDHAFVITRRSKQGYSFSGSDESVSWEAVRTVKYLVPFENGTSNVIEEECPVCLDTFVCPRITKCGHCFCLSCLLRHVHTQAEANKSQAVKCPCCGIPVHMDDVRVVTLESVQPPRIHGNMKLTKLHRTKACPSPYLPRKGAYRHLSPHAAPTVTDADASYSRFNYVDPDLYLSQLTANQMELESALSELQRHQSQHSSIAMEMIFVQMALESVRTEQQRALEESVEERTLAEQYRQPQAGMYQSFPDRIFATDMPSAKEETEDIGSPKTRPRRAESMDSAGSASQHSSGRPRQERQLQTPEAIMYLDQDAAQFYQSTDGQLCFLSRFNMSCLLEEFTASVPKNEAAGELSQAQLRRLRPLPDVIEGNVLEKESVHLTQDVRKRMPFLSHLPLYIDISFVELDLNHLLSADTKQKFKGEMEKRRKKRQKKITVEKRADRVARQKEEARINELKARIQRIDPNDEFFQVVEEPPASVFVGEEFGPSISAIHGGDNVGTSQVSVPPSELQMSFSAVTMANLNPMAMTEDAFPSLSTSPPTRTTNPTWSTAPGWQGRARAKSVEEEALSDEPTAPGRTKGKKSKGKKVLLFSTGGYRGSVS